MKLPESVDFDRSHFFAEKPDQTTAQVTDHCHQSSHTSTASNKHSHRLRLLLAVGCPGNWLFVRFLMTLRSMHVFPIEPLPKAELQ